MLIVCFVALTRSQRCEASEKGTAVKGGIYFDQVWTPEGSPYVLRGNTKVGKGTRVQIVPGTRIVGDGHRFTIDGVFEAKGTIENVVNIEDVNFVAGKSDKGEMIFHRCTISGGSILSPNQFDGHKASVNVSDSKLFHIKDPIYLFYPPKNMSIARNIFDECGGITVGTDGVFVSVRNNLFHKQTTDFAIKNWARYPWTIDQTVSDDGKNYWYPLDMDVSYNTFACTDRVALKLEPQYVDAHLNLAQNNYFGTTDEAVVRSMIYDKENDSGVSRRVLYRPFLSSRHPDTPDRPDLRCGE